MDLRAKRWVSFRNDRNPSIFFEDSDGNEYFYTRLSRAEEITVEGIQYVDDDWVLCSKKCEELDAIGDYVSFSIPEHRISSPQLE